MSPPLNVSQLLAERHNVDKVLAHLQSEHSHYHSAHASVQEDDNATASSGSSNTSMILESLRKPWLAPMDAWKIKGAYRVFGKNESSDDQSQSTDDRNEGKVESLAELQLALLSSQNIPMTAKRGVVVSKRVMLPIKAPDQTFPFSVPLCPDEKALEEAFSSGSLVVGIHSIDGYDFSGEFDNVYKSNTSAATAFKDFRILSRRALLVFDPSLSDEEAEAYALYMGRMALWERAVSLLACGDSVKRTMPQLKSRVMDKEPYPELKVLVGRDRIDQTLCFWVRVCPRMGLSEMPKNANAETKKAEMRAHIAMHLCYYRKFKLSRRRLEEFERNQRGLIDWKTRQLRGSSGAAPPPPPKPPTNDSWFTYIICRQNKDPTGQPAGDEDMYDELDEEDLAATASVNMHNADTMRDDLSITNGGESTVTGRTVYARISPSNAKADPSPCSELVGWGYNSDYSMGIGAGPAADSSYVEGGGRERTEEDDVHRPRPIPLPSSLTLERIASIACSPRHTLVLSCMGNVYVCGENTEGALGLGDLHARDRLTLLHWPDDLGKSDATRPKIMKVAAASGTIGGHSMCIDDKGKLYGWGVPQAVGIGTLKPVLSPKLIDTFPSDTVNPRNAQEREQQQQPFEAGEDDQDNFDRGGAQTARECIDVACGGGFTVVVLTDGRVCSWGMWSHGRIGQGAAPDLNSGRGKKVARYKLRPGFVKGIKNAVSVSCGEAHALCLLSSGEVKVWGQNSCGQLGIGPNYVGVLRDMLFPITLAHFGSSIIPSSSVAGRKLPTVYEHDDRHDDTTCRSVNSPRVTAAFVCCGAYHSIVIDSVGGVYTFGARGSFNLGHNDAYLNGEWSERTNSVFSISTNASEVTIPYELMPWCKQWSLPRRVQALDGTVIRSATAGDLHSCFLAESGHVYICGTGPAVPPIASAQLVMQTRDLDKKKSQKRDRADSNDGDHQSDEDDNDDDDNDEASVISYVSLADASDEEDVPEVKKEKRENRKAKHDLRKKLRVEELIATGASVVRTPRRPSSTWLDAICTKRVVHVSSSGTRCFAILDEENVTPSLTAPLLKRTIFGASRPDQPYLDGDDITLESYHPKGDDESYGSYFVQRGRADCMMLVSGKILLCHRALVASRSPVLRDMILNETPTDDYTINGSPQPTQLLLPELHVDSARALLAFLYTDVLPRRCIGNMTLLRSLERASKTLRIPRLQIICERILKCLNDAELANEDDIAWSTINSYDIPPPTLARDLGTLVGDPEYADVRFICEGRALAAHRFILESRCEYFRTMFRSSYVEGFHSDHSSGPATSVDVVVPDTFVGFLRLLIFIYTDTLPDGSDGALLEDLLCADRYDISDMRDMCESMLVASEDNWLDLLQAADLLNSRRLLLEVEGFVRDNFSVLCPDCDFTDEGLRNNSTINMLREEFPEVLNRIFAARLEAHPLPPSHMLMEHTMTNKAEQEQLDEAPPFPWWALGAGVLVFFLYAQLSRVVALGPLIPIVNVLFILGMVYFMGQGILEKRRR